MSPGDNAPPPNLILIQLDDLGWDDLGLHGNAILETPTLDRLGSQSIRFSNFYVNPVCAPSRAALLTGRHFLKTGVSHVHGGKDFLDLGETTIAEALKGGGYRTGMWGKWHSGHTDGYYPWQRGFDEAYMAQLYKHENSQGLLNGQPVQHQAWADQVITDYALKFIEKSKGKPFFAYLSYLTCHTPLRAPENYIEKYRQKGLTRNLATLYGMVEHVDSHIDRLLQGIDDLRLSDKTVIVFLSDNGPAISNNLLTDEDRSIRYVSKLRGHKGNIWENGVRSPLFVRWKGQYRPAQTDELADITDLFPTLLHLAGVELPVGNRPLDGRTLVPILEGQNSPANSKLSFNFANPGWPPTDAPWTPDGTRNEYQPITPEGKPSLEVDSQIVSVRNQRYKLLLNPGLVSDPVDLQGGYALFDILEDPRELDNLITREPGVTSALKAQLRIWFSKVKEEPASFRAPTVLVGYEGNPAATIPAKAPLRISEGLTNTAFDLRGWSEMGDFAEYGLEVLTPGRYAVRLNYVSASASSAQVSVTVSGQEKVVSVELSPATTGEFQLERGRTLLRLETRSMEPSRPPFEKLISIEMTRTSRPSN
jgi:arylsulfatase A-like enzyme